MSRTISLLGFLLIVSSINDFNAIAHPFHSNDDSGLTLRILHTNDMHSRFEQTSKLATKCAPKDAAAGKCYGGFARVATLVRQARNSSTPTLFLNAGDTYQGSVWFTVHKWRIVARFLNLLSPDAISLGNHEFDNGVPGLVPFVNNASFPVLAANLDISQEPDLKNLKKSTILTVNGTRVGVIGYLTPDTKLIALTGKVVFKDEVESIRKEVQELKEQGVKIFIALGHSGYDMDKKIAKEVEDIDIVIGGHTNTFLYNDNPPDEEIPEGLYPTEVLQKNGRKTYVVQAFAYTKYLGNFQVKFDKNGEVTEIQGSPILVNGKIVQAKDVLDELEQWRAAVDTLSTTQVGTTQVILDGDSKSCRRQECNFGNLITDAMVEYNSWDQSSANGWTDAAIAVQNSGSIRTSITRSADNKIVAGDVTEALPFDNTVVVVKMTGKDIRSMFEWGVQSLDSVSTANLNGAFLQHSGVHVTYDLGKPPGSRVVDIQVQCAACTIPNYSPLKENETYKVLMNDFMRTGGDGYSMLSKLEHKALGISVGDIVKQYLQKRSPVHPSVEWRINFVNTKTDETNQGSSAVVHISMVSLILLPLLMTLLC